MKIEDLDIDTVEILVNDHLNKGWEYTYWGKEITAEDTPMTKNSLTKLVTEELEADGYQVPVNLKRENVQCDCGIWYACIYMDKYDGESCGVVVWPIEKVKEIMENHIEELNIRMEELGIS